MASKHKIPQVFVGCRFINPDRANTVRLAAMMTDPQSLNSVSQYLTEQQFVSLHESLSEKQLIGFVGLINLDIEKGLCHLLILLDNQHICFAKTVIEYICQITQQKHLKLNTLLCQAPSTPVDEGGAPVANVLMCFLQKFSFTAIDRPAANGNGSTYDTSILMRMSITDFLQQPDEQRAQQRRSWQGNQDARKLRDTKPLSPAHRMLRGSPRAPGYQLLTNAALRGDTRGLCRYFLLGNCRFGAACRFPHVMPSMLPVQYPPVAFIPVHSEAPPIEGSSYPLPRAGEDAPLEDGLLLDLFNTGSSKWLEFIRYFPDPAETSEETAAYLTKDMIEAIYRSRNMTPFQSLKELAKIGILQNRGLAWAPLLRLNLELCCNYRTFRSNMLFEQQQQSMHYLQYPYMQEPYQVYYQPYPTLDTKKTYYEAHPGPMAVYPPPSGDLHYIPQPATSGALAPGQYYSLPPTVVATGPLAAAEPDVPQRPRKASKGLGRKESADRRDSHARSGGATASAEATKGEE